MCLGQYHVGMNLGFPEMLFILVVALLIFGPKKLPEIGRQVGKAMNEFKRASEDFKAQLDSEVRQLELNEARERAAASSPAPEANLSPPEGTVPASHSYGQVLDAELDPRPAEYTETFSPADHAQAASAQAQAPAPVKAASAEVTAATPAEHHG